MPLYSIAGSQGTGKTTTLLALPEFPTVTRKTSRSILADWGVSLSEVNNNRELTLRFQDEILKRKIEDEKPFVDSTEITFTERTFADLFTYALVAIGKDNEHSEWIDEYYEKCKAAQAAYSMTFYLAAGYFNPMNDGVRGSNKHYSRMVDLTMYDYTKRMTTPETIVTINTPDLNKRVSTIRDYVRFVENNIRNQQ